MSLKIRLSPHEIFKKSFRHSLHSTGGASASSMVETKFSAPQRLSALHHVSCFQFEARLGNSYLQPTETKQQIISQLDQRWT